MKSIVCVTESLAGGGAERQMATLANLLSSDGYLVSVVTFADLPDHYYLNPEIRRVRLGLRDNIILQIIEVFFYFLFVKSDCVISYRQCSNARVSIPLLFRKVKLISGERNVTYGHSDKYERLLVDRGLYWRSNYIVTNSYTQYRYLIGKRPKWENKLRTIINYTDIEHFAELAPLKKVPFIPIRIAIFSRYSAQKNPLGFFKMVAQLKKRSEFGFVIHWYGQQKDNRNGLNEDYRLCIEAIRSLGIDDVVELRQAVADPSKEMSNYHAVCLPSLYEGFSNSIAEAICCGRLVLCSNVSDNSVMVKNGVNGFLFDPNSVDSMCNAFLEFFSLSSDRIQTMSRESRLIAESLFNKDLFLNQYKELLID